MRKNCAEGRLRWKVVIETVGPEEENDSQVQTGEYQEGQRKLIDHHVVIFFIKSSTDIVRSGSCHDHYV